MVSYIRSDLEFILNQIKIAEAHALYVRTEGAEGQPLYGPGGLIPSYNIAWGLRTVDGSYNHLLPGQEYWGAADREFVELVPAEFRTVMGPVDINGPEEGGVVQFPFSYQPGNDADGPMPNAGPGDVIDPSVRTTSNLIVDQTLGNPAAIVTSLTRNEVEGDLLAIAASIMAAYEPLKPLFKGVDDALDAYSEAQAAADANPGDTDLADAAAAALVALGAAEAALAGARGPLDALLDANGVEIDGANVVLPNIAPDEGLSAPFNSWFTLFGQFFDHGLDLVNKGGNGTVFIPLSPDDPLYDPDLDGADNIAGTADDPNNFMVLTRATTSPGEDGVLGDDPTTPEDESLDDGRPVNTTTAFVDQNQTYTSHPSHQVYLREYVMTPDGPVATGNLIEGGNGGMANWGELKAQTRDMLGFQLTDQDVGSVPLLRTDPYGNFITGPNGFPLAITGVGDDGVPNTADDDVIEGDPTANPHPETGEPQGVDMSAVLRTSQAFLADIAHNAVPNGIADGDITVGLDNGDGSQTDGFYDNELLDRHFIAGDGRVNENIGLTAVHHIFHAEHNRLVEHTKEVLVADAQAMLLGGANEGEAVAFLNEWLAVDVNDVPTTLGEIEDLVWDGERLFQAAKFGNEMQYQHLVFEEFARKVVPSINTFLVPDGFDTTLDPSIVAEFAHTVYRFGHSMLNENIDRFDENFAADHIGLIQGFLNPVEFDENGTVDDGIAAGDIIRGMTRQTGNHIDEFVTSALRNNLLGLPLDLATINLARGRDTGVPTLQEARAAFYAMTNQDAQLRPYESWTDFAAHLKNEVSIINFVAAYGTHPLITAETTVEGKRDAALTIITNTSVGGMEIPADRLDFLNGTGAYGAANGLGGLNDVDLWIGGLAEQTMPFGGMLGSTFQFVFETQMENLQSGDRFYYLQRLDGLHLFGEMENNSFAGMIMRNTNATHLPSDVFSDPGLILEVDPSRQFNDLDGNRTLEGGDPVDPGLLTQLVIRNNPSTAGEDTNYLRYTGGDHVVLGGTDPGSLFNPSGNDILIGGIGDDTIHGDGGNDRLEGGFGNDIINAGDGDDIVTDMGGEDNFKLGDGNDVLNAGPGLDLVLGGRGQDFIVLGLDEGSEVFGGEGDDFILGNKNAERILGNEGNDWLETGTFDGAPGDNFDEIFARDGIDGNDVFLGDGGMDEFIGEGGDDIMVGSAGRGKMAGMSGFDWATYKDHTSGVTADLSIPIVFDEAPVPPGSTALDEYASMEGLSGSAHNDNLRGQNVGLDGYAPGINGGFLGSALDAEGIALIAGLQEVLGEGVTSFTGGDIILGGDGSDRMEGQAGDDILDGDKWLDVQIGVFAVGDTDHSGEPIELHNSMTTLMARMFSGQLNPGQLSIVRTIREADGSDDVDTAVFSDVRANYLITGNADGTFTVAHVGGTLTDGTDTLHNIERVEFADLAFGLGGPVISDQTPTEGQELTADTSTVGLPGPLTFQWQSSADGTVWDDIAGATEATFTPDDQPGMTFGAQAGQLLRVVVSGIASSATAPVGVNWQGDALANTFNGTAGDDIAAGSGAGDILNGAGGTDLLIGDAGNDRLDGGAGGDTTVGGLGNDTHFVDDAGDVVVELAGEGTDVVRALASYTLADGVAVETIRARIPLANSDIDLFGNELNNALIGNAGQNILGGGAGNDRLNGLTGADQTAGGLGNDRHFVDNIGDVVIEAVGEGIDRVFASTSYVLATAAEVEFLMTTDAAGTDAIDLTGNAFANRIDGNAGANTLTGGGGNDRLNGLAGADTTAGGLGNDIHFVDNAGDVVVELAGQGTDRVLASTSYVLSAGAEVEVLTTTNTNGTDAIDLTGNEFANNISGNAGSNNLSGGGGNDYVRGRDGDDFIHQTASTDGSDRINGDAGTDTYVLTVDIPTDDIVIYTRAAWLAVAGNAASSLFGSTEIVVTRNGSDSNAIISQLDNIEEIVVDAFEVSQMGGPVGNGTNVSIVGNFAQTSLSYSTITVNGGSGSETVDISGLTSDHRLVFNSGGGNDSLIGGLRPQDQFNVDAAAMTLNEALIKELVCVMDPQDLPIEKFDCVMDPLDLAKDRAATEDSPGSLQIPHLELLGTRMSGTLLDHLAELGLGGSLWDHNRVGSPADPYRQGFDFEDPFRADGSGFGYNIGEELHLV